MKYLVDTYYCYKDSGPCFGWSFDLQLLTNWDYCLHTKDRVCFQGNLVGNTLCGGDVFIVDEQTHNVDVVNMTTFEIDMN